MTVCGIFLTSVASFGHVCFPQITGHSVALEHNPTLRQRLLLREPYITPLNIQQVLTLHRMRTAAAAVNGLAEKTMKSSKSSEVVTLNVKSEYAPGLEDTLIITMKGIAAGMQNTG